MATHHDDGKGATRAPTSLQAEFGWLFLFARETSESQIKDERTPERLTKMVSKLERLAEKEINSVHARIAELGEKGLHMMPACKKGCWYCCSHMVTSTIPEILRIADHIRANWSTDQLTALRKRITEHKASTESLRDGTAEHLPRHICPLLLKEEGACSVWPERPLVCRGWNSVDVNDCIRKGEHPEESIREKGLGPQLAVADFVRQGLEEGLKSSRLDGDVCELAYGLEIALDNLDAGERYLAGENVFAPAQAGLDKWT
jgi:Fe-S-cluster containining protein